MKVNFNKVMKNKMVLYVLVFLAFANMASFLSVSDYESAVLFVALSVLTSQFTKNKALILLVALLVTQLMRRRVREGMKHGKKSKDDKKKTGKKKTKSGMTNIKKRDNFSSGKIDQAATLKKAYNNLDDMLGKGGMEGVTKDTTALIKQQQQLMKQIEMATPVLNNAMEMMESPTFKKIANGEHMAGMGKMQKMFEKLTGGMGNSDNTQGDEDEEEE